MKSNKIASIAILLWVVTVTVFAWFFIRGNTVSGTDNRTVIVLTAGEREMVLSEMRKLLAGVQGAMDGISRGDMKQAASAARSVGLHAAEDVNPALFAKLPMSFKQLGVGTHRDMDEISKAAENGKPASELLSMLSGVLAKCVSCHAAFQFKTGN